MEKTPEERCNEISYSDHGNSSQFLFQDQDEQLFLSSDNNDKDDIGRATLKL